MDNFSLLE